MLAEKKKIGIVFLMTIADRNGHKDQLKRLIVRLRLTYDDAAAAIGRLLPPPRGSRKRRGQVTAGYVCKVANGAVPSLKLGRAIVRWAKENGEAMELADLGIDLE